MGETDFASCRSAASLLELFAMSRCGTSGREGERKGGEGGKEGEREDEREGGRERLRDRKRERERGAGGRGDRVTHRESERERQARACNNVSVHTHPLVMTSVHMHILDTRKCDGVPCQRPHLPTHSSPHTNTHIRTHTQHTNNTTHDDKHKMSSCDVSSSEDTPGNEPQSQGWRRDQGSGALRRLMSSLMTSTGR